MFGRSQKPTLREFLLMQAQTRSDLCSDEQIFDPCKELKFLTPFEVATLMSWSSDSNADRGLNLYIILHFLSATNNNSCYYHYVNNGNPDGTNMFGHVIGTSGSGKSSALTPHLDALGRTLEQLDLSQEYVQYPDKNNDLSFHQPFIISNATALHVYRSLIYGNRLLCSTECDTLLSNLGVYGNLHNDPRFAENVNMLIQMFDGTKHQNRSTLSTSYALPEGRRASIIGASVGEPYARVSQQHYEGNGISGAHNRFTHYPCPVMKAIKTNSGSSGTISNMIPSLQHVYTVSILLGKVEYVPRQNKLDRSEKKQTNVFHPLVEEKWERLKPMADRLFHRLSSEIEIELEELEPDATVEQSKSAFYYMFNRVYNQWQEATSTEKQEHEAIINFKNSTKIPRFICNFARFRSIMNILWDDSVYPLIEISEVVKPPYKVSDAFILAVKNVIEKSFPHSLRKDDGTKILVIEKQTAIMGDAFFGHVDNVSRRLFDLSKIQDSFCSIPKASRTSNRNHYEQETAKKKNLLYTDAYYIMQSKFIFFSTTTFINCQQFRKQKDRLTAAIDYLTDNNLLNRAPAKSRFIKGAHSTYAMTTPSQIKTNPLSMEALSQLNWTINDYENSWEQCLFPSFETAMKIDKLGIDHIKKHLHDYIPIIHRLGKLGDPIVEEILKPSLRHGRIGIDHVSKRFSLAMEHRISFANDDEVLQQLKYFCNRVVSSKDDSLQHDDTSIIDIFSYSNVSSPVPVAKQIDIYSTETNISPVTDDKRSQHAKELIGVDGNVFLTEQNQSFTVDGFLSVGNDYMNDCIFVLEEIQRNLENDYPEIGYCDGTPKPRRRAIEAEEDFSIHWSEETGPYISSPSNEKHREFHDEVADFLSSTEYVCSMTSKTKMDTTQHDISDQQRTNVRSISISPISSENVVNDDSTPSSSTMKDIENGLVVSASSYGINQLQKNISSQDDLSVLDQEKDSVIIVRNIATLAKRLMLKPFVAFTNTDATRLFNRAETKNSVIEYLKKHQFIVQIDDLFLSNNPTRKIFKHEIGYLKLFPASDTASDTWPFDKRIRENVGITLDEYLDKLLYKKDLSQSKSIMNNVFNTANNKWLLNISWYDKLISGHLSTYYRSNIICPATDMSVKMVAVATVSQDDVRDVADRPRSKLTASQRANKELRKLGAERRQHSGDEPPAKRQRKPKRFVDE